MQFVVFHAKISCSGFDAVQVYLNLLWKLFSMDLLACNLWCCAVSSNLERCISLRPESLFLHCFLSTGILHSPCEWLCTWCGRWKTHYEMFGSCHWAKILWGKSHLVVQWHRNKHWNFWSVEGFISLNIL
jgi:hypothetical protein